MQFKYNDTVYQFDKKTQTLGQVNILNKSKHKLTDFNKKLIVYNCDDFIKEIKSKYNKSMKIFLSFVIDDTLIIFTKNKTDYNLYLVYKFENNKISEVFENILSIDKSVSNGKMTISEVSNNFTYILPTPILEFFIKKAIIEDNNETPFRSFTLKKKNKVRNITAPHDDIKKSLQDLNVILQKKYDKRNIGFQVAYKKTKNIVDNAKPHVKNRYVYCADIKDFFPSCKRERVKPVLEFLFKGCPNGDKILDEFLDANLINDRMFIGSPISGTIANNIMSKPFKYIKNMCKHHDMEFTAYADDLTFSSNKFIVKEYIESLVETAFKKYDMEDDFKLNNKKFKGMQKTRRHITGVSFNENNEMTVSRHKYNKVRVCLYRLSKGLTIDIPMNKLKGLIAFSTMVEKGGKFDRLIVKYEDVILKHKLVNPERLEKLKENA